ncbi:hypothetical protein DFH11DRAFT_1773914 [Phellopilus nigrolimitatus]|nr:hypothetical protein DFH11DRAFT_1773914 [Phellopilus nigrolimitatus]
MLGSAEVLFGLPLGPAEVVAFGLPLVNVEVNPPLVIEHRRPVHDDVLLDHTCGAQAIVVVDTTPLDKNFRNARAERYTPNVYPGSGSSRVSPASAWLGSWVAMFRIVQCVHCVSTRVVSAATESRRAPRRLARTPSVSPSCAGAPRPCAASAAAGAGCGSDARAGVSSVCRREKKRERAHAHVGLRAERLFEPRDVRRAEDVDEHVMCGLRATAPASAERATERASAGAMREGDLEGENGVPVLLREFEDNLGRAGDGARHGEERAGHEQQRDGTARVGLDAVVGEERVGFDLAGGGVLLDVGAEMQSKHDAFASVLQMDKDFDKANEISFRLGIIYKQQGKYTESLECFDRILRNPPSPLAHADIWFQIGHIYEQQKDHARARDAYERVLQQLGCLGPLLPVILDVTRRGANQTTLAPMDIDRAPVREVFPRTRAQPLQAPPVAPCARIAAASASSARSTSRTLAMGTLLSGPPPQTNGNGVSARPGQPGAPSRHSSLGYSSHYDLSAASPIPSDTWERERRGDRERERVHPRRDSDRMGLPPLVSNFSHAHLQSRGPASPMSAHPYEPPSKSTVSGTQTRQPRTCLIAAALQPGQHWTGSGPYGEHLAALSPHFNKGSLSADSPPPMDSPPPAPAAHPRAQAQAQAAAPSRCYDPWFDESPHGARAERINWDRLRMRARVLARSASGSALEPVSPTVSVRANAYDEPASAEPSQLDQ